MKGNVDCTIRETGLSGKWHSLGGVDGVIDGDVRQLKMGGTAGCSDPALLYNADNCTLYIPFLYTSTWC